MIGLSRARFSWREPQERSDASAADRRAGLVRLLVVISVSTLPLLVLLYWQSPAAAAKALAALALILLFICAAHFIHARFAPYIAVTDRRIYRSWSDDITDTWKYKDIARCEVQATAGADGSRSLVIETVDGRRESIAMPPTVSLAALGSFLAERGVTLTEAAEASGLGQAATATDDEAASRGSNGAQAVPR